MNLYSSLLFLSTLFGQAPAEDLHHDFRGDRPLPSWLKLIGPEEMTKAEAAGLRITLPANRKQTQATGVATTMSLSGDFEITAAYEILSADRPTTGYGVGVALSATQDAKRKDWAMIGRLFRPMGANKSVYMAEFWTNAPTKDYKAPIKPTETAAGRLRLVRQGDEMTWFAAEGDGEFVQVLKNKFTTEDMGLVRLIVNDGGNPPYAVDARLVDLTIRTPMQFAKTPVDVKPEDKKQPGVPLTPSLPATDPEPPSGTRLYLFLAGLGVLAAVIGGVVVRRLFWSRTAGTVHSAPSARHGPTKKATPPAADLLEVQCPNCAKRFRVSSRAEGKKVKCSGCAEVFVA